MWHHIHSGSSLNFSVLTEIVAFLDFCFIDLVQNPALCLLGYLEIDSPPAFSSNQTPLLLVGELELMSLWTTWQVTFEMAQIPLILLFLRKGQIIGKKNFRWGAILRVYEKAHFVDKIWTVWKIYKSLKILRSPSEFEAAGNQCDIFKASIYKSNWVLLMWKEEKITVRKLYWTWHKSEVCNLGAEVRQVMRTQSTCGLLALQSWRQDRMVLGGRRALQGPRAVLRYCS